MTAAGTDPVRLPDPCLVVLVGPAGAGKTTWAARHFPDGAVVSSDRLRAAVGHGEHDQRASPDAFAVLHDIVGRRLSRRLVTVVDSLGLDPELRSRLRAAAAEAGIPCHAVAFAVDPKVARARNQRRARAVPAAALTGQLDRYGAERAALDTEGFDGVHDAVASDGTQRPVRLVEVGLFAAPAAAARQRQSPRSLTFDLQIPSFEMGEEHQLGPNLAALATAAEDAGFDGVWLMDHLWQIPHVGRPWERMLESYTTLGYLAAATRRVRLGTLVTGITYRNVGHLGKIVATLDVLSGGRAWCGLGAAWYREEHQAYGWEFPPPGERLDLLEDALGALRVLWGPGSPSFEGRRISLPDTTCYPRPLQDHLPILVGGSGERRTLRLVAQHADACNLFGDPATFAHKVEVLHRHCADVGRDPEEVLVTNLTVVEEGTSVDELVGLYRSYADAGLQKAIVSFRGLDGPDRLLRFSEVIEAFAATAPAADAGP